MRLELEVPDRILEDLLAAVPLPQMAPVRYDIPTPPPLTDPNSELRDRLRLSPVRDNIRAGQSVAIGVGSRGIHGLSGLVRALVAELRSWGAQPFIVPAMGSHGGATAGGQAEVLEHLDVLEETVGVPVRSSMEVVRLGSTQDGLPVYLDRLASGADAIVFVARVKPHTAFRGPYESGLAKMVAIGLGKQAGAAVTHAHGFGSMARMVPEMARLALERAPIRFGVAILENAYDLPFRIEVVPAERILADEPGLLEQARAAMPHIPFPRFDVLVIDRIGKNISGDGADPNITGRFPTADASGGPEVNKQVVLDLTDASAGNANGAGTADFTTVRLARKIDLGRTYPNALTSTVARPVALPMVLPSDRLAIQAALSTCNAVGREPRVVRITDTLHLGRFSVSSAMLAEAASTPGIQVLDSPSPLPFDDAGNLMDLGAGSPVTASITIDEPC